MGGQLFFIKRTNGVWKFILAKFSPHNFFNNFSQNIFGGKYADLPISKILWTRSKCPHRLCVRQVLKKKWKCETGLVGSTRFKFWRKNVKLVNNLWLFNRLQVSGVLVAFVCLKFSEKKNCKFYMKLYNTVLVLVNH